MTDLPRFLPWFGVTGPGCCIMKATKTFFRSLFRLNMQLKKMTRLIACGVFGLLEPLIPKK